VKSVARLSEAKAGAVLQLISPGFSLRSNPGYKSSFNLYRMILPEPVRGIASIRCTALGTL
jgi:hypothetical protein